MLAVLNPTQAPRSRWISVRATGAERAASLPGDAWIRQPLDTLTHASTIGRPAADVWPWLVQMGAHPRAGWYSYDWLDNGRHRSATRIVPDLQDATVGTVFPALPGRSDGFTVLAREPGRHLVLGVLGPDGAAMVTWTFVLREVAEGRTRLIVRVRGSADYRFRGLPRPLTRVAIRGVHFVMQRRQLLGLKQRVEAGPGTGPATTSTAAASGAAGPPDEKTGTI